MAFLFGDKIKLEDAKGKVAKKGATAIVIEGSSMFVLDNFGPAEEVIRIEWIRDGKDNGQANGVYRAKGFIRANRE